MSKRKGKRKDVDESQEDEKPSLFQTFKTIVSSSKRGVKRQRDDDKEPARPAKKATHTKKEQDESVDGKGEGARKKTKKELRIEVTQTVGPISRLSPSSLPQAERKRLKKFYSDKSNFFADVDSYELQTASPGLETPVVKPKSSRRPKGVMDPLDVSFEDIEPDETDLDFLLASSYDWDTTGTKALLPSFPRIMLHLTTPPLSSSP